MNARKKSLTPNPLETALKTLRGGFVNVGLFSFFINLLMLTGPLYMLQIYDRVLSSRSQETLLYLTVLAGALLLTSAMLTLVRSRVLVRLSAQLDERLNTIVFNGLLRIGLLRPGRHSNQPLRDLETLRNFLTGNGLIAFFDAPWTPIFLAVVFLLHPLLGFIALGGAVVLFTVALLSEMTTRKPLTEASKNSIEAYTFADSTLRNAEAVEAMGMLPGLQKRWLDRHESSLASQSEGSDRAGLLSATARFIRPFLQVAILGAGAWLAIQQIVSPGVMIAASIIMGRALAPIEQAIGNWRGFVMARAARDRLKLYLDEVKVREPGMPLPRPSGKISVQNLVAGPPGAERPVLKGLNFAISEGECIGIIGPSAAGKSTLARLLVGIWPPAAGNVRLDGADVARWDHIDLGPHLGYLPQDVELFDGTVAENIRRFGEDNPEKVVEAAQRAGCHEMILHLPQGYDTMIGEAGAALSGGQRQRIGLARAIYNDPALVVLDEPNSNLDGAGEEALRDTLVDLKKRGMTVIVIAHRPSVLGTVDRLMVLRDGRVEHFGPRDEVLAKVTRPVQQTQRRQLQSAGGDGGGAAAS